NGGGGVKIPLEGSPGLIFVQELDSARNVRFVEPAHELTKIGDGFFRLVGVVPDKSAISKSQGVVAIFRIAAPLISGPEGVIRLAGLGHPLVPIAAIAAGGVEIIEQNKLARQFARVGHHFVAVRLKSRVAIAFPYSAKILVVRPVLLDDVDNVLDG